MKTHNGANIAWVVEIAKSTEFTKVVELEVMNLYKAEIKFPALAPF